MQDKMFISYEYQTQTGKRDNGHAVFPFPEPVSSEEAFQRLMQAAIAYLREKGLEKGVIETIVLLMWRRLEN